MSDHPPILEYANPIEDQPPESDAVIERTPDAATITIPPKGWSAAATYIGLSAVVCGVIVVAVASGIQGESNWPAVTRVVLIAMLIIAAALWEGRQIATQPTVLCVTREGLKVRQPSLLEWNRSFNRDQITRLFVTIGTPRISRSGMRLTSNLCLRGVFLTSGIVLRQRDKQELRWIQREILRAAAVQGDLDE